MNQINESDWRLFRARLPEWQKRYAENLISDYLKLLADPGNSVDKIFALGKRIQDDQKNLGTRLNMSRSHAYINISSLLDAGVISFDDLEGFSDDLRKKFCYISRNQD